jgi:serine/threonine protein kinase
MASVLIYLKELKVLHRDLKLENFLLKDTDDLSNIKLIDFGLSRNISSNFKQSISGTPYYVAPETLLQQASIKSDIWSLGVILYVLLSGTVPFKGIS